MPTDTRKSTPTSETRGGFLHVASFGLRESERNGIMGLEDEGVAMPQIAVTELGNQISEILCNCEIAGHERTTG